MCKKIYPLIIDFMSFDSFYHLLKFSDVNNVKFVKKFSDNTSQTNMAHDLILKIFMLARVTPKKNKRLIVQI